MCIRDRPDGWISRQRREDDPPPPPAGGRDCVPGQHTVQNAHLKLKFLRKEAEKKAANPSYETRAERRARERLDQLAEAPTVGFLG